MKTSKFYYSVVLTSLISLIPAWALAAKAGDNGVMTHRPFAVEQAPLISTPTNPCRPKSQRGTVVKPTFKVKPNVKLNQSKPSMVKLPNAVKRNTGNKLTNTDLIPAANTPGGIDNLPGDARMGNAAGIRDANQAHGVKDAREAAEAMGNVMGAPERIDGINPKLGLGGNEPTSPIGDGFDTSKLPGHTTGGLENAFPMPDPTTPNKSPANAAGDGPSGAWARPSGDLRGIMGGAASQSRGSGSQLSSSIAPRGEPSGETPSGGSGGFVDWDGNPSQNTDSDAPGGFVDWDGNPIENEPPKGFADWDGNITGTQDPDSDSGGGIVLPSDGSWRKDTNPLKLKQQVINPGPEGATPSPQALRLSVPEDQLVINPDPNDPASRGGTLNEDAESSLRRARANRGMDPADDQRGGK